MARSKIPKTSDAYHAQVTALLKERAAMLDEATDLIPHAEVKKLFNHYLPEE